MLLNTFYMLSNKNIIIIEKLYLNVYNNIIGHPRSNFDRV